MYNVRPVIDPYFSLLFWLSPYFPTFFTTFFISSLLFTTFWQIRFVVHFETKMFLWILVVVSYYFPSKLCRWTDQVQGSLRQGISGKIAKNITGLEKSGNLKILRKIRENSGNFKRWKYQGKIRLFYFETLWYCILNDNNSCPDIQQIITSQSI